MVVALTGKGKGKSCRCSVKQGHTDTLFNSLNRLA